MIRRVLLAIGLLLLSSIPAFSQSTTVSGQITDASAQAWNNGTYSFVFVPSVNNPVWPYTWSGGTLNTTISGSLNATGGYSVSIPSNSAISPVNSSWNVTFCPQASSPCFVVSKVTITGATQTINATPPTILINLQSVPPPALAYSTSEVTGAVIGSQFYLLGTGLQICNAVSGNTCTTWGAVGGSNQPGVFSLINYGGVDDDSTDNCANGSVAAFTTAVNGYSGTSVPVAMIAPGSANKAYKLATNSNTCTFAFTRTGGVKVIMNGNIDCAQTAQSCMQLGPSGQSSEIATNNYVVDGVGTFLNGANLTLAGIYVEPGVTNFRISHLQFGSSDATTSSGFGAANATLGNCTNYSVYVDTPVADGVIDHVLDFVISTGTTAGGCGFANPNGSSTGTNTVFFEHNTVGTAGAVAGGTQCGSIGILDGGSLGTSLDNNLYGFGMDWRIQGIGHKLISNQGDAAGCTAKGVSAIFHIGGNGSSTAVGPVTIADNTFNIIPTHTTNLMAIAGDSSATIFSVTISGNQNVSSSTPVTTGGSLFPPATPCTINGTFGNICESFGNQGFAIPAPGSVANQTGWGNALSQMGAKEFDAQNANLGSNLVVAAPVSRSYLFWCYVVETTISSPTGTSTLPSCVVTYTDAFTSQTVSQTVTATNTTNVLGATQSGFAVIPVNQAQNINISTTGYASGSAGVMKYSVVAFIGAY